MKKFLKDILIFSLVVVLCYPLMIVVWGECTPKILQKNLPYKIGAYGHLNTRIKEAKTIGDVDVLILGSSHAYRGIDTRIFAQKGIKAFNLGSSAQSPIQSYLLAKRYLSVLKPELVLMEVYPGTISSDGLESSLDLISNDEIGFDYASMLFDIPNVKLLNSIIYSTYRQNVRNDKAFTESLKIEDDTYVSGGFVEKEMTTFKHLPAPNTTKKWKLKEMQLSYLSQLIKLCEEKSIRLILIQAPITKSLYLNYSNNDEYDEIMKKQAIYENFNHISDLDDSLHFSDPHHLNQRGVEIFNSDLLTYLSKSMK